ncbi:MAG: lysozyme inhibitor LprI family protein [bacterium]
MAAGLGLLLLVPWGGALGSDCDGNTLEILECLEKKYKELDSKLNHLYRRILDQLGPSAKQTSQDRKANVRDLFVKAQKAWISFRDEECRARYSYFSEGSMGKLELMECQVELTKERLRILENWLDLLDR